VIVSSGGSVTAYLLLPPQHIASRPIPALCGYVTQFPSAEPTTKVHVPSLLSSTGNRQESRSREQSPFVVAQRCNIRMVEAI
jgi:hypothetical protein